MKNYEKFLTKISLHQPGIVWSRNLVHEAQQIRW